MKQEVFDRDRRAAGGRVDPSADPTATALNSGMCFSTGSVKANRPRSWSIIAATDVTALVIE